MLPDLIPGWTGRPDASLASADALGHKDPREPVIDPAPGLDIAVARVEALGAMVFKQVQNENKYLFAKN